MLIGITGSGGGQMRTALKLALSLIAKSNINEIILPPLAREPRIVLPQKQANISKTA